MPKVTGLSESEVQTLNETLEHLLGKAMAAFEERVDTKTERVLFKGAQMAMKMAHHLSPERKLGMLVEASNNTLPKLTRYFNAQALVEFVPAELKTAEVVDLCERAGAKPLADILRKGIATPTVSPTNAAAQAVAAVVKPAAAAPIVPGAPVIPQADLTIASTPVIPAGPGG